MLIDLTRVDLFAELLARGLQVSRHLPGKHDQSSHGRLGATRRFAKRLAKAAKLNAALDSAPVALKRAPGGHHGDYDGEDWKRAPVGVGSVRALSEYEGPAYQETNTLLRGGYRDPVTGEPATGDEDFLAGTPERIVEIDKTMSASRLPEDVEAHRIVRFGASVFGRDAYYGDMNVYLTDDFDAQDRMFERWGSGERADLTGMSWRERGYSSTTVDPKVAEDFGGRWREFNSAYEGEPIIFRMLIPKGTGAVELAEMGHAAELLLEHDLDMTVVADHGVDADGYRRLDIEVSKP